MVDVRQAAATKNTLGEGPVWVDAERALRWVDIESKRWHSFRPDTGRVETFELDERLTSAAPIESGDHDQLRFLAAFASGLAVCDGAGVVERWLHRPEIDIATNRFNDGGTDPRGRYVAGSMNEDDHAPTGAWYVLGEGCELRTLRSGVGIANTVAFSPDGATVYAADSATRELAAYAYDAEAGRLGPRIDAFRPSPDLPGVPDGSATDAEGFLWNARWDGGRLVRLAPDGSLDRTIQLPVSRPTSCAFVGTRLYVTSARIGLEAHTLDAEPWAGSLLVFEAEVAGVPRPPVSRGVVEA